jgi:hypothetical protein
MKRPASWCRLVLWFVLALAALACKKPDAPASPAEVKEKLETGVKYGLWKVDATDDQKEQFDRMLDGLSVDLFALQQESTTLKRRTMNALAGPAVDATELERIDADGTALFSRYMKRMTRAALDASTILTVEQRQKVVGLWHDWEFGE